MERRALIERIGVEGRVSVHRVTFLRAPVNCSWRRHVYSDENDLSFGMGYWIIGAPLTTEDLTGMATFRLTLRPNCIPIPSPVLYRTLLQQLCG
jgi:hypothetical protein